MGTDERTDQTPSYRRSRRGSLARRSFLGSVGTIGLGALGSTASAQSWPEPGDPYYAEIAAGLEERGLPPGEFLLGSTEAETMDAYDVAGDVTATTIDAPSDLPFAEARRLTVDGSVENPWDAHVVATVPDRGLQPGDVLLGVAYLREAPGNDGAGVVQYSAKDVDQEETNQVVNAAQPSLDEQWRRYDFQIEAQYVSDPDDWWTELFLGYGAQTVDVGGLALVYLGQDASLDALPDWNATYEYEGRADDAAWRQAARDRIDERRRGPLEVVVETPDGAPVPEADVHVEMQAHEFGFGSAISVNNLVSDERYQEVFRENFNEAVVENGLKRPAWDGEWGSWASRETTRSAVEWLNEHDVPTRGHALLWATYDFMGADQSQSTDEIVSTVDAEIRERASAMEGQLLEWDMHNHPVLFDELTEDVGREHVPDWWAAAREADPETPMWANEGNVLSSLAQSRGDYYDYLEWLTEQGVEVDGIGFMGHFSLDYLRPPAELVEIFDEFAAFDAPLKITELDVAISDRSDQVQVDVQRDYLRDVLIAAFSHDAVTGVLHWGFWAGAHWEPSAALYDEDWTLRPHGEVYRRLVFEEWWTDESGTTDADGTYSVDAFLGEHRVEVTHDGETYVGTVSITDPDDGTAIVVTVGDGPSDDPCVDAGGRSTTVDGQTVCDLNEDGSYRDVDADGSVGQDDVVDFFEVQHRDAWKQDAFDFSGNGEVNQFDAVELFDYVLTN